MALEDLNRGRVLTKHPTRRDARRGPRGATGKIGATGKSGPAGRTGATGARGEPASKDYILAAVADQFEQVRKQLDQQLIRTGQIQAELDLQRRDTIELRQQLKAIQSMLKKTLNQTPAPAPARDQPESN